MEEGARIMDGGEAQGGCDLVLCGGEGRNCKSLRRRLKG